MTWTTVLQIVLPILAIGGLLAFTYFTGKHAGTSQTQAETLTDAAAFERKLQEDYAKAVQARDAHPDLVDLHHLDGAGFERLRGPGNSSNGDKNP